MCGLAGMLTSNQNSSILNNRKTLELLAEQQHRGPDETFVRSMEQVSIGTCRLSIVDRDFGTQPIVVSCHGTKYIVALNGEIYNFRELNQLLNHNEHRFVGNSDTEVLAHLFEEKGIECLHDLNGMFSICISDGITTYLARDRFGQKPLYYRFDGNELIFASEARSLVKKPVELVLEPSYPYFETTVGFQTPFAGVKELPPGHYIIYNCRDNNFELHCYYSLDDWPIEEMEEEEALEIYRWLVKDAVSIRTNTDLPFGSFVSGGIDSSIIAAISRPDILLSAVVTERDYMDERYYLDLICQHLNKVPVLIQPDQELFLENMVDLVYSLDFPVTTLAAFTQYLLSKEASARGLRIILSGLGADECMGGYTRHAPVIFNDTTDLRTQFPSYISLFDKYDKYDKKCNVTAYFNLINRTNKECSSSIAVVENYFNNQNSVLNQIAATDMGISFPPLLRVDDRINMRFSIESRSPFLDYRVVEFAYHMPNRLKIRKTADGTIISKYLLRRAFQDIVPAPIIRRTDKIGFPSPIALWLAGPLYSIVLKAKEVIKDIPELDSWLITRQDGVNQEFSRISWQLVQWAIWSLLFIHGLSPAETKKTLVLGS